MKITNTECSFLIICTLFVIPLILFSTHESHATIENNLYKFDTGFYEKIQQMQAEYNTITDKAGQSAKQQLIPTQHVLINTINGTENQLREILVNMNATNVFVSIARIL